MFFEKFLKLKSESVSDKKELSPLLKRAQKSKEQYSLQAVLFLREFKEDFDLDDFEKWVRKNIFIIGPPAITQYLLEKANERNEQAKKDDKIKAVEKELTDKKLPIGQIASIISVLKEKMN